MDFFVSQTPTLRNTHDVATATARACWSLPAWPLFLSQHCSPRCPRQLFGDEGQSTHVITPGHRTHTQHSHTHTHTCICWPPHQALCSCVGLDRVCVRWSAMGTGSDERTAAVSRDVADVSEEERELCRKIEVCVCVCVCVCRAIVCSCFLNFMQRTQRAFIHRLHHTHTTHITVACMVSPSPF
jgi:hypothetical protein